MNKEIHFFEYEQCYEFYKQRIETIRQQIIQGEIIVAKPALIVALIDGIDNNIFTINQFVVNDWLEERYKRIICQYTKDSQYNNTGIEKPFWHLESDGFWHLIYQGDRLNKSRTPSRAWLKTNVQYAYFEESLWILLQNKNWRSKMRDYIVSRKLDIKKK